ncbi:MAG: hypothetical protein PHE59_04850 [Patescibacteria group bacterium]|nr:hypothetical protein [Patescibacteria group bacterium]MDD5164156.1 hypothetical protein [Patescibacteria group bacterium]MDD5534510.1 hypothetical protein [Patescibacteria group bacterium]
MKKINKVLEIISEKLKSVDYAFIGSVNLYIQGLKIKPRDIDILTTPEIIKEIDEILKEYLTKEIYFDESEGRNSFRSFYEIDGMEIEVLGNVNNISRKPDSLKDKIYIEFDKIKLPCMPLNNELDMYEKIDRKEKVEMIKKFYEKEKVADLLTHQKDKEFFLQIKNKI